MMKLPWQRQLLNAIVLILSVNSALAEQLNPKRSEVISESNHSPNSDINDTSARNVERIWQSLRAIQPSTSRISRLSSSGGILGTSVYYAQSIFVLLFMNAPPQLDIMSRQDDPPTKLSRALSSAVDSLEVEAYVNENPDALWLLAEMNFHGNFTHPRNYTEAFAHYHHMAAEHGNSSAQYMLGFMYATGIGGAVDRDQAKALLYHTFAADAGHVRSQMIVAYRHHAAIGTPRNCETAAHYYRQVAKKSLDYYKSGPPGGHVLTQNAYRLADEYGGVYGQGSAISSFGSHARPGPTSDSGMEDQLEYLDFQSRKGDLRATFGMAKMHYDGARGLPRDLRRAKDLFIQVARTLWPTQGPQPTEVSQTVQTFAPRAAGFLGRMFLRGEGIEQSYSKALIWFRRGLEMGDSLSQYSLGLMYLDGLGVPRDPVKAAAFFRPAADNDLAVAQTELGKLFLDQGDIKTARQYFDLAVGSGHIEAHYYLAQMIENGLGREKICAAAVSHYTTVSQLGELIHSSFLEANEAYARGDLETALVAYMMAAEQGYESAQANVAALMDQTKPKYSTSALLPFIFKHVRSSTDSALALVYWTRSAAQRNLDSMIKMGDYYLEGIGTDNALASAENAAQCYQAAAESMSSAQGMWNLGWMHENGIGMQQDFHLAKRFYDQALETHRESYLPVKLALMKLHLRSWWNGVSGGKVNSIKTEPASKPGRSFGEWFTAFLEADAQYHAQHNAQEHEADDWDPYELRNGYNALGQDADAVRERGEGGLLNNPSLILDLEPTDGVIDAVIIVMLVLTIVMLVYWRRVVAAAERRREAAQRAERDRVAGLAQAVQSTAVGAPFAGRQAQSTATATATATDADASNLTSRADQSAPTHKSTAVIEADAEPRTNQAAESRAQEGFPPADDPNFSTWTSGGIGH